MRSAEKWDPENHYKNLSTRALDKHKDELEAMLATKEIGLIRLMYEEVREVLARRIGKKKQ